MTDVWIAKGKWWRGEERNKQRIKGFMWFLVHDTYGGGSRVQRFHRMLGRDSDLIKEADEENTEGESWISLNKTYHFISLHIPYSVY